MRNQLKAGAVLSYVALFINSVISILYTPIMLNLLGQSEYGLYSLGSSAAGYLGVLVFGLGNAVIRYTARFKALNDEEGCSNLYGMFLILYVSLGALALLAGTVLTLNSEHIFSNSLNPDELSKLKILMTIMVINISIGIGLGLFSVIVLAHEKFIFQKLISIANSVLSPLVMLPLLLIGYGSIMMAIVTTVINILYFIISIYYCFRVLKIKITFKKFESGILKEIIVFSSFIFINLVIDKIYWSTDQIILGIYSGTIAISIYTIGASFTGYFSGFSSAISNVFLSKVSGMVIKDVSDKEISELFIRIGRVQFIIISFALSGFLIFGQEFIILWVGNAYTSSYIIAALILVPMIIPLIQSMGGIILQAKNKQKFQTYTYLSVAIANVFLSIFFVKWWGPIGCALATAIAFTVGNIFIMNIYYWKKIGINIPKFWKNILFMSFPLFISISVGYVTNNLFITNNWFILFSKIIVFSFIYIFLMWCISMNRYEKELIIVPIINIINKVRKKSYRNQINY